MSYAQPITDVGRGEYFVDWMNEHDLLDVVEIEETSGLSLWGWDAYRTELDRTEAIMLVARHTPAGTSERQVIGFVAARVNFDELHINNIGVRVSARRRGVGGALLGTALQVGARQGARAAVLEVRAANESAQALYRRFNFFETGVRRNYYRDPPDDALVMRAQLSASA